MRSIALSRAIAALVLFAPGCVDDKGVETGSPLTINSFSGTGTCTGSASASLTGQKIIDYQTKGLTGSSRPTDPESDAPSPGNPVKTSRVSSSCNGETSWRPTSGSDGSWYATGGDNTLLTCGGAGSPPCGTGDANSCSGTYQVDINPDTSESENCASYDPVKVDLDTSDSGARRAASSASSGSSGSGNFYLIPLRARNKDADANHRVTMLPIQLTGTGVMTNLSWVTQIDIIEDNGLTLKVIEPNEDIVFDAADQLGGTVDAVTLSAENPFSTSEISGNPIFVAEEVDLDDTVGLEVYMEWSNGSGPTLSQAQGYEFSLEDIGCDDYPQKFVIRMYGDPLWVAFEQYGNPNYSFAMPTTAAGGGGRAFSFGRGMLYVAGVVHSHDSQDAEVEFTTINWDGSGICTPDTYMFLAE